MLSDELLQSALDCGISVLEYWDMTPLEINQTISSYNRRHTTELKERAIFMHKLADLIGVSVARLMSKSAKYPPVAEVFPSLFPDENVEAEKAKLMHFATMHNALRGDNNG